MGRDLVVMRSARIAAVALVAGALAIATAPAAHAAPARMVIQGDVLQLVSIQDAAAMTAMVPGVPVAWDVGVSASRGDGEILVRLEVDATDDAFSATVDACAVEWDADGCATGAQALSSATLVDGVLDLAEQPSSEQVWYRVAVTLDVGLGDHRADLVVRALGFGDEVASGGDVELPPTGLATPGLGAWLAGGAVVVGVVVAAIAHRRRRGEVDA